MDWLTLVHTRRNVKMARMHSGAKGKSGSLKPENKTKPTWLRYSEKEVEMLILKMAKEEMSSAQIGVVLRDSYGIPDIKLILGKSITAIMKEKGIEFKVPEDMENMMRRVLDLKKHIEFNHKDYTAKRGLQLTESKIRRLMKYYKKTKVLPADWKYDPNNIRLYIE